MEKLKYFQESEFSHPNLMSPLLLQMLDTARGYLGEPIVITSSYRTKQQNEDCCGSPNSAHLRGNAVDIRCSSDRYRLLLLKALIEAGFERIGVYEYHIHVDVEGAWINKLSPSLWIGKY